jgi:type I restriction enzyme, S subunit
VIMASPPSTPKADWEVKTLGDLTEVVTKGTTPTSVGYKFTEQGIAFVKVESITPEGNFLGGKLARINEDCHNALKRSQLKAGDILFSIAGALGRTAIVSNEILPANTNQALAIIRLKPSDDVSLRFIEKALSTGFVLDQVEKLKGGVAQQNLSLSQVKSFRIPLPPLAEQERIVGILDEAFEGIAVATAQAEKNLHNARELFQSVLQSTFSQKGDDWEETTLKEVCGITSKLADPQENEFIDLLHVGGANIESDSGELHELKTAREEQLISGKFPFDESMVLYSKIRPYLKKVSRPSFRGLCSADIYPLAPNAEILERDFLFHLLLTADFTDYAIKGSARAGMPKVNRPHLFAYSFNLPPLPTQQAIVEKLDALSEETKALEAIYERKQSALAELKQSLLQKAFAGEL